MNQLMTPEAVAQQYGIPVDQLARWRRQNRGPAYYVLTRRTVRYDADSVHAWFHQPNHARFHNDCSLTPPSETTRDGSQGPA